MFKLTVGERYTWQFAWLIASCIPITVVALAVDPRLINDISIWTKPLKFELSLAVHLLTLAVLVRFVPGEKRAAHWLTLVLAVIAVACFAEIVMINMQSLRGVGSHFNTSTAFDARIYQWMGIGALLLTLPVIAVGVRFATLPAVDRLTPGLKLGAALGLIFGALLTFIMAGYLSIQASGHWVDAPPTDLGGLPLAGWSRSGGDLRAPHFIATHLMQVVPLVGWIVDRRFDTTSAWPRRIVWATAVTGAALAILTFMQARAGQPLI